MTHEFATVPKALAHDRTVSNAQKAMYLAIAAWTPNKKDGLRYIHRSELGAALGIKEKQVSKLTAQLCAAGWLHKEGDGGCNRPARYLPLQEKTIPSQGRVLEANHPLTGEGQSIDILISKSSISIGNPRAGAHEGNADAGDRNRFKLPTHFQPPTEWMIAAKQARADAGKPELPPAVVAAFPSKFVAKQAGGRVMDLKTWRIAFINWFVDELPKPQKTVARKESAPSHPAAPRPTPSTFTTAPAESPPAPERTTATLPTPEAVNVAENANSAVTTPTPSTAPAHDLSRFFKGLFEEKAMPRDTGYQSRPAVRGAPPGAGAGAGFQSDPDRRAFFAAQLAASGIPIPANCAL